MDLFQSVLATACLGGAVYLSVRWLASKQMKKKMMDAEQPLAITPATKSLINATDGVLLELVPEGDLNGFKKTHDEMEAWLHTHIENGETAKAGKTLVAFTDMVIVQPKNLNTYVESQVKALIANKFTSDESRAKFAADFAQVILVEEKFNTFHKIDIEDKNGGTRMLETYLFKSQKLDDGNIAILLAYFADKTTLIRSWQWLVANHDMQKIRKWLNYKLFTNIMAKGRSLVPRQKSVYLQ